MTLILSTYTMIPTAEASSDFVEDYPIWRAQVEITTGNVKHAGTDDDVVIKLNDNNKTWLDYIRDDFEQDDKFTYDLNLSELETISDIEQLVIDHNGDDGWCFEKIVLKINGKSIFEKSFNSCKWFDDEIAYTSSGGSWSSTTSKKSIISSPPEIISGSELREHILWNEYAIDSPTLPTRVDKSEITSRLESYIGDQMHGTKFWWSTNSYINVSGSDEKDDSNPTSDDDSKYLHVDFMAKRDSYGKDPQAITSFDIQFGCTSQEQLNVSVKNMEVIVKKGLDEEKIELPDWLKDSKTEIAETIAQKVVGWYNEYVEDEIRDAITPDHNGTLIDQCPNVQIHSDGNLTLDWNIVENPQFELEQQQLDTTIWNYDSSTLDSFGSMMKYFTIFENISDDQTP